MTARLLLALAVLLLAAPPAAAEIKEKALARHIAVLADDAMAGRKPGTPGGEAAERYIAEAFAHAGLKPGAAGAGWFQPVHLAPADGPAVTASNVVGRIEGSDRGADTVLFLAHWDHLGLCAPAPAIDRICNGAVDNASGVAMLIEIAHAIARGPRPRRNLLFVATTGEEMGLLGAKAFVADPPVPIGGIVAAVNLDTAAIAPRGAPVTILGRGLTRLDPIIDAVARSLGRAVDTSDAGNALFKRQDGYVLYQAHVPAVLISGGFADGRLMQFLDSRYHRPDDDAAHALELGGAAEDADLHVALGRALADPDRFPVLETITPSLDTAPAAH